MPLTPPSIVPTINAINFNVRNLLEISRTNQQITNNIRSYVSNTNRTVQQINLYDDREILAKIEVVRSIVSNNQSILLDQTNRIESNHQILVSNLSQLTQEIENLQDDLQQESRNLRVFLNNKLQDTETRILKRNDENTTNLKNQLISLRDSLKQTINNARSTIVSVLRETTAEVIGTFETGLSGLLGQVNLIFVEVTGLSAAVASIVTVTADILWNVNGIFSFIRSVRDQINLNTHNQLRKVERNVTSYLDPKFKELNEKIDSFDQKLKDLPHIVSDEVSLSVVGESYYKWDSTSSYFPTLCFLFKEAGVENQPKRSQIKLRLKKRNQELDQNYIEELKVKCRNLNNLQYNYGTIRGNYVSSDKRFKTTVFGASSRDVELIMCKLCELIDEPFQNNNLSITENRRRMNHTKRESPLGAVKVNPMDYNVGMIVQLWKVVLLVNGLERPVIIYRKTS